ncbi:MAG: hypothetical protein FJY25_08345 [Betaproteobacteria bacterium]|nr:hypothetical protein [Betaproteobacteria bacterium]
MRREVRDHWQELLDAERRPTERGGQVNAVLSAKKILLYATFGTAGVALAIPIVITAAVFTAGLLHEGVTTIQALLGR